MDDIAFEAQTSVQAAGRMVQQVSEQNLVSRQRFDSEWEVRATEKGRATQKARSSEVPKPASKKSAPSP